MSNRRGNLQLARTRMGLFGGKSMVRSVNIYLKGGPKAQPGEGKGEKEKDWVKGGRRVEEMMSPE